MEWVECVCGFTSASSYKLSLCTLRLCVVLTCKEWEELTACPLVS